MEEGKESRVWTRAEVAMRNTMQSAAIIIDNLVYDVTEFLEEHPGGAEVLLDNAGKDASRCFHEVGHSEIALDWRAKFLVGSLVPEDQRPVEHRPPPPPPPQDDLTLGQMIAVFGPPALLAIVAYFIYIYIL